MDTHLKLFFYCDAFLGLFLFRVETIAEKDLRYCIIDKIYFHLQVVGKLVQPKFEYGGNVCIGLFGTKLTKKLFSLVLICSGLRAVDGIQ